tara:strand:+ start:216 stop:875 length:660 start_codon:yes stop_codon:yes gene_type:complete
MSHHYEDYHYLFKTVIVGDTGVGKSSILRTYIHDDFTPYYNSTIGIDFHVKVISIEHEKKVKLHIWDTAGTARFQNIVRNYYKDCLGCVVVFDVTNQDSFENVTKWIKDVHCHSYNPESLSFVLVGNKIDMTKCRQVSRKKAADMAANLGMHYVETSAKFNTNIEETFGHLILQIVTKIKSGVVKLEENVICLRRSFALDDEDQDPKRSRLRQLFKCCP